MTPEEHRAGALEHIVARCVEEEFGRECFGSPGSADRIAKAVAKRLLNRSDVDESAEWDGTSAAHPAWWRGQDDGVRGATERVQHALDVDLKLRQSGKLGCPKLQAVYDSVLELRHKLARAEGMAAINEVLVKKTQEQRDAQADIIRKLRGCIEYVHDGLVRDDPLNAWITPLREFMPERKT